MKKNLLLPLLMIQLSWAQQCIITDTAWKTANTQCKNGFIEGQATAFHSNGKLKFEGLFEKGSMVEGMIYFQNKPFFLGKIVNHEMHGDGICYFKDKPEACTYYKGDRIDAIYKLRFLMRQQLLAIQAMVGAQMQQQAHMQSTYQSAPVDQGSNIGSQIGGKLMDKAAEKAIDAILNNFF